MYLTKTNSGEEGAWGNVSVAPVDKQWHTGRARGVLRAAGATETYNNRTKRGISRSAGHRHDKHGMHAARFIDLDTPESTHSPSQSYNLICRIRITTVASNTQ